MLGVVAGAFSALGAPAPLACAAAGGLGAWLADDRIGRLRALLGSALAGLYAALFPWAFVHVVGVAWPDAAARTPAWLVAGVAALFTASLSAWDAARAATASSGS